MSRERAQALLCDKFGIRFPYVKMGNIDSLDLFGPTELMIFAMYEHNRKRWHNVLDIGANLGLHSVLLGRLGAQVRAYEPDPDHFQYLLDNVQANNVHMQVETNRAAVHISWGEAAFIRVLNNLTGNHLLGYKDSYGPRDTIIVPTVDCRDLWSWADFAKIDSEGNESVLIGTLTSKDMAHLQLVVEVRNRINAESIWHHMNDVLDVPMWPQKIGWQQAQTIEDLPHMNREGSLFIGHRGPWE